MSHLVGLSGVRDAQGRRIVTLPPAVADALKRADVLLRQHGMQFELLCEACYRAHPGDPNAATVVARHGTGGMLEELHCQCSRRRFGVAAVN